MLQVYVYLKKTASIKLITSPSKMGKIREHMSNVGKIISKFSGGLGGPVLANVLGVDDREDG